MKLYNDCAHDPDGAPPAPPYGLQQAADCLVPQWPAPACVRALCTTRQGGTSQAPYHHLNLGTHVGDAPERVADNRRTLADWLAAHTPASAPARVPPCPPRAVFLNQVHGTEVLGLDFHTPDGLPADAAMTDTAGLACTVLVADCLPILLCNAQGSRVAAVHAGWRGLAGRDGRGVVEAALSALHNAPPASAHSGVIAWLGPCIGPSAFEVGDEVRDAFAQHSPHALSCFKPLRPGKWLADLPGLARQRLHALGVTGVFGNDGSPAWCTVGNPSRFFSYRRDGVTGRMAACIWRSA